MHHDASRRVGPNRVEHKSEFRMCSFRFFLSFFLAAKVSSFCSFFSNGWNIAFHCSHSDSDEEEEKESDCLFITFRKSLLDKVCQCNFQSKLQGQLKIRFFFFPSHHLCLLVKNTELGRRRVNLLNSFHFPGRRNQLATNSAGPKWERDDKVPFFFTHYARKWY